jgi:hypothetical protein
LPVLEESTKFTQVEFFKAGNTGKAESEVALPFLCAFLTTIVIFEFILDGVKIGEVHTSQNKETPIEGAWGVSN